MQLAFSAVRLTYYGYSIDIVSDVIDLLWLCDWLCEACKAPSSVMQLTWVAMQLTFHIMCLTKKVL